MSDLISRHKIIKAIDRFIPVDPMKSDYTQGISVGIALATRCIEEFSQETDESSQGLVKDLISRQDAIDEFWKLEVELRPSAIDAVLNMLKNLPSAQPEPERKKGKWICQADDYIWNCSECDFEIDGTGCIDPLEYLKIYSFCPNCGSYNGGEQDGV